MKWICSIMAFIILTLSVQPLCVASNQVDICCNERIECRGNEPVSNPTEKSEKDCAENCNPFQICGCCPFSVIATPIISLLPFNHISITNFTWGITPLQFYEEPISGFWQPPKIY